MSALGILALLSAAAEALPNGTPAERAAWCKAKEREFQRDTVSVKLRGPKPFSAVAHSIPKDWNER